MEGGGGDGKRRFFWLFLFVVRRVGGWPRQMDCFPLQRPNRLLQTTKKPPNNLFFSPTPPTHKTPPKTPPTMERLRTALPGLRLTSFDHIYDESTDWETLYQRIAEEVCTLAAQQSVIYAVPGHPLVGETSVQLILQLARERGLRTNIIA